MAELPVPTELLPTQTFFEAWSQSTNPYAWFMVGW